MSEQEQRRRQATLAVEDPPELDSADLDDLADEEDEEEDSRFVAIFADRRRMATVLLVVALAIVAIYFVFPKVVGVGDALDKMGDATWYWLVVAVGFTALSFVAYVALFRGILGGEPGDPLHARLDARASYQITMAGLAATRVFSAAGAGGIALTYWALRKAGMPRRRAACRMVAFLVLMYTVYLVALVIFGVLLRTGVLSGDNPAGGTIVPAAVAGGLLALLGLVALIPGDVERRLANFAKGERRTRFVERVGTVPATISTGVRTAISYIRHPSRGALGVFGAIGFWAANIGCLWASFEAYGGNVPFAVLVQGFFVGMAANLIPSPAGGVGSVDAGMIGAFVLFGVPSSIVFPAVLTYRVIAFWLPIPPGVVAYFQLRRTIERWRSENRRYAIKSKVTAQAARQTGAE